MRRPHRAVGRLPLARPLGLRLRKALLDLLSGWTARARTSGRRRPGGSRECRPPAPRDSPCAALLAGRETEGHGAELILAARRVVADVLGIDATTAASKGVWPEFIRAQVKASGDPDTALADWFERGALWIGCGGPQCHPQEVAPAQNRGFVYLIQLAKESVCLRGGLRQQPLTFLC